MKESIIEYEINKVTSHLDGLNKEQLEEVKNRINEVIEEINKLLVKEIGKMLEKKEKKKWYC